jgi:predicted lipoprotein with Yx(FWY)xxD motif
MIVLAGAFFAGALAAPVAKPDTPANTAASGAAAATASPSPTRTPTRLTFTPGQAGAPGEVTTILQVKDSQYGPIVVNDAGYAIYMSDSDDQSPPRSVCYNACAKKWIPVLTSGTVTLDDAIAAAVVGTLQRADGGTQLTMRGWPLYLYVNDKQPGEINGHSKVQHWQVLAPDGKPIP